MYSRRRLHNHLLVAAMAAFAAVAAWPAAAQNVARVDYVPVGSHPPIPAGLQQVCVKSSDNGAAPSKTCPVVHYQGITTWAYSYLDNRVSMALVKYDGNNNVIGTIEKPGARYVFEALSSARTQTVLFVGQARQRVTATWAELAPQ